MHPTGGQNGGMDAPDARSTARLFLAVWPDAATRDALAAWRDACRWPPGTRQVPDAHLHLTLHFLGAVDRGLLDSGALAAAVAMPMTPCGLDFDTSELWSGHLAVMLPRDVPRALRQLHASLSARLRDLGLQTEARAWRPHVTLARQATGAELAARTLHWQADGYALVESGATGYTVLQRWPAADATSKRTA